MVMLVSLEKVSLQLLQVCRWVIKSNYFGKAGEIKMFEDKSLVCKDCGQEFVFTAGEQEFYSVKGFQNEPGRCKECRSSRKTQFNGGSARRERELFDAVCAECGKETKVPFKPRLDKPVFCSECFANR